LFKNPRLSEKEISCRDEPRGIARTGKATREKRSRETQSPDLGSQATNLGSPECRKYSENVPTYERVLAERSGMDLIHARRRNIEIQNHQIPQGKQGSRVTLPPAFPPRDASLSVRRATERANVPTAKKSRTLTKQRVGETRGSSNRERKQRGDSTEDDGMPLQQSTRTRGTRLVKTYAAAASVIPKSSGTPFSRSHLKVRKRKQEGVFLQSPLCRNGSPHSPDRKKNKERSELHLEVEKPIQVRQYMRSASKRAKRAQAKARNPLELIVEVEKPMLARHYMKRSSKRAKRAQAHVNRIPQELNSGNISLPNQKEFPNQMETRQGIKRKTPIRSGIKWPKQTVVDHIKKRKKNTLEVERNDIEFENASDDLRTMCVNGKEDEVKYSETEKFNAIQFFGKPMIRNIDSLRNLCIKSGIPFSKGDFLTVKYRGWKGKFDSRHILIIFSHCWAAYRFSRALKYAQKHKNGFQRTRHLCVKVPTTKNRFTIFDSLEVPDSFDFGPISCKPEKKCTDIGQDQKINIGIFRPSIFNRSSRSHA